MKEIPEAAASDKTEPALDGRPRRKRSRLLKFALPLLVLWTLWLMAEPISRNFLIESVQQNYAVDLELEHYDLGATLSSVELGGLRVRDLNERELLRVDSLQISTNLWSGIQNEAVADVVLVGAALTLWKQADGRWNLAGLPREQQGAERPDAEPAPTGDPAPETEPKQNHPARVKLELRDSTVTMLGEPDATGARPEAWSGRLDFETEVVLDSRGAIAAVIDTFVLEAPFLAGQLAGKLGVEGQGESRIVTLDGLGGQLSFAPDQLRDLFELELPAQFADGAREQLAFDLNGSLVSFEWPAVLDHLESELALRVAGCTLEGFSLDGDLKLSTRTNLVRFTGEFESNGGRLGLQGELIPTLPGATETEPALRLTASAEDVGAGENAAELFSMIHPAFSLVDDLEGSTVDGRINGRVELTWGAPIPWERLMASEDEQDDDAEKLDLTPLTGHGELAVNQVVIEGSALLQKLREELDDDAEGELRLRPLDFGLRQGRLTYENPWTWTIGDTVTSFEGSVGLDQTLDLSWNVPVTKALVDRYRVLRKLEGKLIALPIRGTTKKPLVEYDSLIQNLGGTLLDELLPGLPGLTGTGGLTGQSPGGDSAESLFESANELWKAEKYEEAAVLYGRIREEFNVSIVYALNRKLIKKRAKYPD